MLKSRHISFPLDAHEWLSLIVQTFAAAALFEPSSSSWGGLYTPSHIPRGVRAESEDCLRTKFGQILAEIPAKFENPSPNLVLGQLGL